MPSIAADGASLNYRVDGPEGAPWVVFSNSLGTDLSMWDVQAARLADRFRVLRYDSRGHGKSDAPEGEYTLDMLGRDLLVLMDALDIETARYCGLSKGGMVGMWMGINAPERIERLALCNTAAQIPTPEMWDGRIRTVREKGMDAITPTVLERWFTQDFRDAHPESIEPVRRMLLTTPPQGYMGCCAAIRDMDQREAIRAIDRPTLVLAGRHDPATTPAAAEEIAAAIPGARLEVIDAAHLSNIEAPAAFDDVVLPFLERGN